MRNTWKGLEWSNAMVSKYRSKQDLDKIPW